METEKVREHCLFVAQQLEQAVADNEDLGARFEGVQMMRFKVEKDCNDVKVVGGELGGDDSGIVISESSVTRQCGGEIVGCALNEETRSAMVEFFQSCYYA